jgi:hypothetical protein
MPFSDSQYDNELLNRIALESPTFAALVRLYLQGFKDDYHQGNVVVTQSEVVWLGSFIDGLNEHTQVQLVLTQDWGAKVDEE